MQKSKFLKFYRKKLDNKKILQIYKKFEKDLNIILEHVDALSKMNIEDEEINIHPLGEKLNLREDVSSEFLTHDEAMSNSPETEDGHFVVPPSLD